MKTLLTVLALLFLAASGQAQCAPPNYCGSTSLLPVAVWPSPPPVGTIAGAGAIFRDPVYGTKGVRLTDACFDPSMVKASAACPNGTLSFDNGNNSYSASQTGSADDLIYNTGDFLTIVANSGGRHYLVGFDKNTLALSRPYASYTSGCPHDFPNCHNTGGWATADGIDQSLGSPCKVYTTAATTILSYIFGADVVPFANPCSPSIVGPPPPSTVVNLIEPSGNCLPLDFGTPTWSNSGGESLGDALLVRAFSSVNYHVGANANQGTGIYAVAWSPTKGCTSYNTATGVIKADIGWAGGAGLTCGTSGCTGTSGANAGAQFTLHNVKMNKSGTAVALVPTTNISGTGACQWQWIWVPGTTTVYCSQVARASGHWVLGSKGLVNDPGSPLYQFWYRLEPAAGPSGTPAIVNSIPSPACLINSDQHSSWQSADANDTWPFITSRSNATIGNDGLAPFDPPVCAWVNELVAVDMNGDGLSHRLAFTFNTGFSIFFNSQWGIPELSPSGRFTSVGSDWFNTLRNAAGTSACNGIANPTSTCIPNGPSWKTGKAYALNYIINPTTNSYQATAAGTSGATAPTWASCATVGSICSDNGIVWKNVGAPSGVNAPGTDAFMWDLQSLGVAPVAAPSNLVRSVQ
jgi:hypothetical protein